MPSALNIFVVLFSWGVAVARPQAIIAQPFGLKQKATLTDYSVRSLLL